MQVRLVLRSQVNRGEWGNWGGALVFQAGYHPHKRTSKTHPKHVFSGMQIDHKYTFLHAFFLICLSCVLSIFVNMTKNIPFFPILHVFAPLNDVRAYFAWSWKTTLISWIFLRGWYPTSNTSAPPRVIPAPFLCLLSTALNEYACDNHITTMNKCHTNS